MGTHRLLYDAALSLADIARGADIAATSSKTTSALVSYCAAATATGGAAWSTSPATNPWAQSISEVRRLVSDFESSPLRQSLTNDFPHNILDNRAARNTTGRISNPAPPWLTGMPGPFERCRALR